MQIRNLKKYAAMTLAEVLITLVILGTVSALVIPTLKYDADRSRIEGLFKKVFYDLNCAVDYTISELESTSLADFGSFNTAAEGDADHYALEKKMAGFWNIAKACSATDKCFASTYAAGAGSAYSVTESIHKRSYLLTNGVSIAFASCSTTACDVIVDLNGVAQPNADGYDLYFFTINEDGLEPSDSSSHPAAKQIIENDWKIPDAIWN